MFEDTTPEPLPAPATSPLTGNPPQRLFIDIWGEFVDRFSLLHDRLLDDLDACWNDLQGLLDQQASRTESALQRLGAIDGLAAYHTGRTVLAQLVLFDPIAQWERRRPVKRATQAVEAFDRGLEDLARIFPETHTVDGAEADVALDQVASGLVRRQIARLRKPAVVDLRAIVTAAIAQATVQRTRAEGRFLVALAEGSRQICRTWEFARTAIDSSAKERPVRPEDPTKALVESLAVHGLETRSALQDWREWRDALLSTVANAILDGLGRRARDNEPGLGKRSAAVTHWVDQLRTLDSEFRLHALLASAENAGIQATERTLDGESAELQSLREELDRTVAWIDETPLPSSPAEIPVPSTEIVPSASRLTGLQTYFRQEWDDLPELLDSMGRFTIVPGWFHRSRQIDPRSVAQASWERIGRPALSSVFEAIEAEHSTILQTIEQAREVISFGIESASVEQEPAPEVLAEAIENARSLLAFRRDEIVDWRPTAERRAAAALSDVFDECRVLFTQGQASIAAHVAQQGVRRAAVLAGSMVADGVRRSIPAAYRWSKIVFSRGLIAIGWMPVPQQGKVDVVARTYLPDEFTVDLSQKSLPAIYRRLFRMEAVDDARFLVGRQTEMDAIAEARAHWEAGRSVAVLIVGERGSGKTSLVNCAVKLPLDGLEIVRGEFSDRVTTEADLRAFLAKLIGEDDIENLEDTLRAHKRVVIVEEFERAYLRRIGGYAAIKAFKRLIATTSESTLWILVMNQSAFKLLEAATNLSATFSHRLNVASVRPESLRDAILLRHNLSGLRLHFERPPDRRPLRARLKSRIVGDVDDETLFFTSLSRQSDGVFRAAFDIWLGHIETAQAGVLYLAPIVERDLAPVVDALSLDRLFTLAAILQHGSLDADEHAQVFETIAARSRAELGELIARGLVEKDPGRSGFRIRPEAARLVKTALYKRNIL